MILTGSKTISSSAQILPGTVEETDLADGAVTNVKVSATAAIAQSKLTLAITNAEVAAAAAIVDTKLAQLTTASKVSGAALTSLASIPSGAGVIPSANIPTSAGLALAGSNLTEGTTTSTTAVDVLSVTGLSIAAATPILVVASIRRTGENANISAVGMKLNTTQVVSNVNWDAGAAATQSAIFVAIINGRVTSHLRGGLVIVAGQTSGANGFNGRSVDADMPTATITDVVITGNAGSANTFAVDELRVFTLPV